MTAPPEDRPDPPAGADHQDAGAACDKRLSQDSDHSVLAQAVGSWLLIQLAVLGLSALQAPLWYRAPDLPERAAAQQMLAAQVVASALLFPWLLRDARTAACVILTSAPFALLAAMMSEAPAARAWVAWSVVGAWMVALAVWSYVLRGMGWKMIGVGFASAIAVGWPVLRYLRWEFHHFTPPTAAEACLIDPATAAVRGLQAASLDLLRWSVPLVALLAAVLVRLISRAYRSRQVIHNIERPRSG